MIKPSARWCAVIALSVLSQARYVLAADPASAARDAAGAALKQFGSSEAIRRNASLPLTSGEARLSTIDGSDAAAVQISQSLLFRLSHGHLPRELPAAISPRSGYDRISISTAISTTAISLPCRSPASAPTVSSPVMPAPGIIAGPIAGPATAPDAQV